MDGQSVIAVKLVVDPTHALIRHVPISSSFDEFVRTVGLSSTGLVEFEYEDEDGDLITVRTPADFDVMLSQFVELLAVDPNEVLTIFATGSSCQPDGANDKAVQRLDEEVLRTAVPRDDQDNLSEEQRLDGGHLAGDPMASIDVQLLHGLQLIGSGNFGSVYKAFYPPVGSMVAVKLIDLDPSSESRNQVLTELTVLCKCQSEYIVGFLGASFVENRVVVCTELMDAGSLDGFVPVPLDVLSTLAVAVVRGLCYLWSLRLMHRDVKPSNILLNYSGQVKLCDFGVSGELQNSVAKSFVGTNVFLAPERVRGDVYNIQSDFWSLGVTLFWSHCRRFPFFPDDEQNASSASPFQLMQAILHSPIQSLPSSSRDERLFADFVGECLERDVTKRPHPKSIGHHFFLTNFHHLPAVIAAFIGKRS